MFEPLISVLILFSLLLWIYNTIKFLLNAANTHLISTYNLGIFIKIKVND